MPTPSWARRSPSRSPLEEDESIHRPEPQDHLADDPVVRLRAEAPRVRRCIAVVAEREEVARRDRQWVADIRSLRGRGSVRADEIARLPVHVKAAGAQI